MWWKPVRVRVSWSWPFTIGWRHHISLTTVKKCIGQLHPKVKYTIEGVYKIRIMNLPIYRIYKLESFMHHRCACTVWDWDLFMFNLTFPYYSTWVANSKDAGLYMARLCMHKVWWISPALCLITYRFIIYISSHTILTLHGEIYYINYIHYYILASACTNFK